MEKERKLKLMVTIALIVSVLALSVAYAAYSATLLISGTVIAKKTSDTWNVHFEAPDGETTLIPTLGGNAKVTSKASLTETSISNFEVTFYAPGDSITYNFDVKNTGSVDATLNKITMGSLTCSVSGQSDSNSEAVQLCQNLSMTITKLNGENVLVGDKISVGNSQRYILTITWNKNDTFSYSNDIRINVGETKFDFAQD